MPRDLQHVLTDDESEIDTYYYDRNRAYKVYEGTRCVSVSMKMRHDAGSDTVPDASRMAVQTAACEAAVRAYADRWGPVDWWVTQMLVSHTTIQVVVELRCEIVNEVRDASAV